MNTEGKHKSQCQTEVLLAAKLSSVLPAPREGSQDKVVPWSVGCQEGRHCAGRNEAFYPMFQTAPKCLRATNKPISSPPQAVSIAPVREKMSHAESIHSAAGVNTSAGDFSRTKFIPVHSKHQGLTPSLRRSEWWV